MRRKTGIFLALVVLLMTATVAAFGQTTGGSVTGVVLDTTGAVVPNATVTLRSRTTGQELVTQTTSSGSYTYPNVPVGDYTISIESSGFQTATQEIRIVLNQTTTVNVTLQAGGIEGGVVEVTAASEALVQADTSQLGRSFETRLVQNLPVFGNQNALALLSPNVVGQAAGTAGAGGTVGGIRPRGNSFSVDGVDNDNPSVTGPSTTVIQDAVAEFTLLTNNFNAEFGGGAGGQFNTVTRTGTNEFHGSVFTYLQHQRLNAASSLQEAAIRAGTIGGIPRFRDVRYGGTIGGPIVRNQLFFFGAVERRHQRATGSRTFLAPTGTAGGGIDQIATIPGASPFVVNLLRNNLELAQAQTTTRTVLGRAGIPFGTVIQNLPSGFDDNLFQINVDHLRGTTDQFRYRFSFDRFTAEQAGLGHTQFNNLVTFNSRLFSANWVRTISPSLVNDLRLSYRRAIQQFPLQNPEFNNFPNLTLLDLNLQIGPGSNLPQGQPVNNSYQVFNTLNYIRGNHAFKFGGEFRRLIFTSTFLPRARGDYWYFTLDRLLQDLPPDVFEARGVGTGGFTGNQWTFYLFGQDDWKVTPSLTLNLGLRYEYYGLPRDVRTQGLNAIANAPGVIEFGVPATDTNNFAPRVGFAWSPNFEGGLGRLLFGEQRGQGAIRANFAVSYFQNFQNLPLLSLPPQFQTELRRTAAEAAFGINLSQNFLAQGGLPARLPPATTTAQARLGTQALIPDYVQPYSLAWSLSYQRELSPTMALELRYLGTRARKMPVQVQLNPGRENQSVLRLPVFLSEPTPAQLQAQTTLGAIRTQLGGTTTSVPRQLASLGFLTPITAFLPQGNSQYDSGSISLTRRFSQGVAFTAAYTWSKTIDNSTNELFTSVVNPRRPEFMFDLSRERGLSALDIPHRFVFAGNYEVPLFRQHSSNFVRSFFGGWELAGIFQAQSGQPWTPLSGRDVNLNLDAAGDRTIVNLSGVAGTGSAVRPVGLVNNVVTTLPFGSADIRGYVAVNPNAQYIQAGEGVLTNAGRNTIRSRGFNRTDMTVLKNFRFGEERYNLQVGAEVFNLFNQRVVTIAGVGATNSSFPFVSNQFFNDYSIGNYGGRTVQLRAKFIF